MARTVLVCDDAASYRAKLCGPLEKGGYVVTGQAANGEEAVALFSRLRPDLVLLDITMPVMDGVQALEKILQADPDAAVLMLAAPGQRAQTEQCLKLGAKGAVEKPFRDKSLLEAVKQALA